MGEAVQSTAWSRFAPLYAALHATLSDGIVHEGVAFTLVA